MLSEDATKLVSNIDVMTEISFEILKIDLKTDSHSGRAIHCDKIGVLVLTMTE